MFKKFLIAIRKPLILTSTRMRIKKDDTEIEEQRLTNILLRRVVILNDNLIRIK